MYRIIGIGETINYLRQNEASKELPDKCIKALDLFWIRLQEIIKKRIVITQHDNDTLENSI